MLIEDGKHLKQYFANLEAQKAGFLPVYTEIQQYLLPHQSPIIGDDMAGTQRSRTKIFDNSPTTMVYSLAASINSSLTNPSTEWFDIITDDEKVNENPKVKKWFDEVGEIIFRVLENSNFYTEISKVYTNLVAYGIGPLFIDASNKPGRELYFSARHIKEIYLATDIEGMIDTVFRKCKFTCRQLIDEFGKRKVSDKVKEIAEKNGETYIDVLHCVFPRGKRDPNKIDPVNKPFASVWMELDTNKVLRKSGYNTFPYIVPRWSVDSNEVYARSLGMDAIPDVKTLNDAWKTLLRTAQKMADPPIMVPDEGFSDVKSIEPGAVYFYDAQMGNFIRPLEIGGQLPVTLQVIQSIRDNVAQTLLVNKLHMIDTGKMTAEEVRSRQAENTRVLSPTFGMFQSEMLTPLITRVYDILSRKSDEQGNSFLPEPPDELQGREFKLKFTSPLAKSQRVHEAQSISYTVGTAIQWSQTNPAVMDNIDMDEGIRKLADVDGTPPSVMRDKKDVAQIRQIRSEQMRKQAELEQEALQAETLQKGAKGAESLSNVAMKEAA